MEDEQQSSGSRHKTVTVVNETKNQTISECAQIKNSFWGRFKGLMISPKKDIILEARHQGIAETTIHMAFMLYPIDVIWVNEDMEVVDIKKDVKPSMWKMHKPKKPARYIIELGMGNTQDTTVGDSIIFRLKA